jgi:hypothetical protein
MKMKTKSFAVGLAAAVLALTGQAQSTLDQSVISYQSAASAVNTGHRLKWKVLPQLNETSADQNKIDQYRGVSSQPWTQVGGWHPADSAFQDGDAVHHEPQFRLVSLNF